MRNWEHIDTYVTELYGDIYPQPLDEGHYQLSKKVIDRWMSLMPTCRTVLDVGCGEGHAQFLFERWKVTYEGVCLGQDYLRGTELGHNVKKMDFNFLEYPDNSFDMVFSRHSLEHSPMPLLTLFEWSRVAKNWLGLIVPAVEWYGNCGPNHYSVMNQAQWRCLLDRAGWHILWDDVDELNFVEHDKSSRRPHEYWFMAEKKKI